MNSNKTENSEDSYKQSIEDKTKFRQDEKQDKTKSRQQNKKEKSYNIIYEFLKGLASIFLLVSVLATLAMLADLYFNYFLSRYVNQTGKNLTVSALDESTVSDRPLFEVFDDEPDTDEPDPEEIVPDSNESLPEEVPSKDISPDKVPSKEMPSAQVPSKKSLPEGRNQKHNDDNNAQFDQTSVEQTPDKAPTKAPTKAPKSVPPVPNKTNLSKNRRVDGGTPRVAIIIDDIGYDFKMADAISRIDRNLTISILPGSPSGRRIAQILHARGTQIMLHLPMEPLQYPSVDPGYGAILSNMAHGELVNMLNKNLDSIPHVKGINNHMGSKLTTLSPQMNQIFTVLKKKNLFFIDSLTSKNSTCSHSAKLVNIAFAQRDIFLDNIKESRYIKKQFRELKRIALQNGTAIAIGHPYRETYIVLKEEILNLKKNVVIVPVSELVAVP
ncbi:MAG: divergent polysaccharide deacetylase family protein [Desulfamplus sp.]|nr:divergent polysaccharide deacetylase family protein [Desulfamplus sp.]